MSEINDREFIARLEELKEKDIDTFMEVVLFSLKSHPDFAVTDLAPTNNKIDALKKLLSHFEKREDYEDCAFIRDLQKRIEDAEEG